MSSVVVLHYPLSVGFSEISLPRTATVVHFALAFQVREGFSIWVVVPADGAFDYYPRGFVVAATGEPVEGGKYVATCTLPGILPGDFRVLHLFEREF